MKKLYIFIIVNTFFTLAIGQTDIKQTFVLSQHYGGGIIFYLDPTGQHGLIAAPFDQPGYGSWVRDGLTGANYMNDGALNTKMIVTFMKRKHWMNWEGTPAACMCDSSKLGGFSDWYLPSINELKAMYDEQFMIGNFIAGDYCSSTERDSEECWNIHFKPNKRVIFHYHKVWSGYNVRCIRKF